MATPVGELIVTISVNDNDVLTLRQMESCLRWLGSSAQCTPSRNGIYTAYGTREFLWPETPILVEEDSIFAPREVNVESSLA